MATPGAPKTQAAQERKWEVENAARTLIEAERIKADKKLLEEVTKELAKQAKAATAAAAKAK